ncbi:MAG: histidine phosphatase family protein [Pseudohongiellaceae bacterium]
MSELILVRHGQASFGEASYDRLSELGHRQVRILADHWQAAGEHFDHLYSGSLRRQQETARALLPLLDADRAETLIEPALNEYSGDPLISSYLRDHGCADGFDIAPGERITDRRLFQQVFEAAATHWINDTLNPTPEDAGYEAWPDFQRRVHGLLETLMQRHGSGSRVLVSTSGGVIALMVQAVLRMPDAQTIATNWMVNNSGVTRIRYGRGRRSLVQFNSLSHLETPPHRDLITYR